MSEKSEDLSSMANLLKNGATMMSLSCPACSSPIFRLKSGKLWCAQCRKNVIVEKNTEQKVDSDNQLVMRELESTILEKIQIINDMIKNENNPKQLEELVKLLSYFLENLEKVLRMKNRLS